MDPRVTKPPCVAINWKAIEESGRVDAEPRIEVVKFRFVQDVDEQAYERIGQKLLDALSQAYFDGERNLHNLRRVADESVRTEGVEIATLFARFTHGHD